MITKNIKYASLALCLTAAWPVSAQETADSALVNVAFRKVAKADLMGGVSTVNYRELTDTISWCSSTAYPARPAT